MFENREKLPTLIRLVAVYLFGAIVLYTLNNNALFGTVRDPLNILILPITKKLQQVGTGISFIESVVTKIPKSAQNEVILERRYNEVLALQAQVQSLTEENEQLRGQLEIPRSKKTKLLQGALFTSKDRKVVVLTEAYEVPMKSLVSVKGNLIGEIAGKHTNRVYDVLPTVHPNFKAKARIERENEQVDGIIEGLFGTQMKLTKVLSTAQIGEGELVVLADEEKKSTATYVVGKITQIKKDEAQVFKEAFVMPLYNKDRLDTVFVEVVQ